ncbi:bifunctional diguanylate cyclase/phosphodiesterase [Methylibium rhizosphaerae]|uniref:bifunctional diguanylate cyclase/phosphodiesterase n=1 Tax=Methylibium rhizosphaerae TaxID=2570323 RepID=UPI00112A0117|nr:LapD/MoxY N-terminal periplasmic domain-containing protein [Methylibium rhizosphaerae]
MSLIRQMWLLLLGVLLLAFVGSVTLSVVSARSYLETQLRLKNNDNAQALALSLSQQKGDAALMELAAAAQFDTGYYQRIVITGPDGREQFRREASVKPSAAPGWFVRLIPIESVAGVAQLSDGWRALGQVEVVSHSAFVYGELWNAFLRMLTWMAALGLLAGLVGTWALRRIERPLNATVGQAQALVERRFITVNEPAVPELQRLTRAMNAMVARLKLLFDEQSVQVEELRRQAHCDALTGVSHRRHFMAQLATLLESEDGPGTGTLVLVRVQELAELNTSLGHQQTDRVLQAVAKTLREAATEQGGEVGRLNGSDFALSVPGDGNASSQAATALLEKLHGMLTPFGPLARVVLAAVNWQRSITAGALMSNADAALARAESRGAFALEAADSPLSGAPVLGEDGWRQRIGDALAQRRLQLGSYPLQDRDGRILHLECPLRLQLEPGGEFLAATEWLPMAMRTRLVSQVDEAAVVLALDEIARDRRPRGVNLSSASLQDSAFLPRLRNAVAAAPQAAASLWLEVGEAAAVDHFALLRELCTQLRPLGVKVGLEHAGRRLASIDRLFELGLDYVKLDASVTRGVAGDAALAEFVKGSAWMLHGLGLQVYAEGVASEDDALALWANGADGITGPWVR